MSTNALRAIATGQPAEPKVPKTFPAMLEAFKGELVRALPKHLNADTMTRIALTCFRMNPLLAKCEPASVFACVVQASQLGLRPGLLGECYLIPYFNKRKDRYECQMQVGYQGLLELVRRSGLVQSVGAYLVRSNDTYAVKFGSEPGIQHEPCLDGDPGDVRFGYAVAQIKGGGVHIEVMTRAEIERIRARSQNVQSAKRSDKQTPWDTDWDEMARKTLVRRICKYLPKSPELALSLTLDDAAQRGQQDLTLADAVAGTFVPVIDAETGEIATPEQIASVQEPDGAKATPPPQKDQKQAPPAFDFAAGIARMQECRDAETLDQLASDLTSAAPDETTRDVVTQTYRKRASELGRA